MVPYFCREIFDGVCCFVVFKRKFDWHGLEEGKLSNAKWGRG